MIAATPLRASTRSDGGFDEVRRIFGAFTDEALEQYSFPIHRVVERA